MKLALSLVVTLLTAYLMLLLVRGHLHALSGVICSGEFTITGIACNFVSLAVTLLAVPCAGLLAGFLVWGRLSK